ncbi:MAG: amidohydrolase family protein [Rhodospirillaceae bacterium]
MTPSTMPVADAHHHIWRLADLTWLNGPTQPRIFGDYESLKRDYSIEDFRGDRAGAGVEKSVYIQVNWPAGQEVNEAAWVQEVAEKSGWPHAIVGYVDFAAGDASATLKALSQHSLMRGIRQQLHWHENPLYKFQPTPDLMNQAAWRKNFTLLQDYNWTFELQVFASQMTDAARLAADFPATQMILQHCGMPEDTSDAGRTLWRDGMKRLADQPNIHCKFSGLGTFIHRNDPGFIAEITGECLDMFGAARCVFGSNYPIEKLWTEYGPIVDAFRAAVAHLPEAEQAMVLHDNAVTLYRL